MQSREGLTLEVVPDCFGPIVSAQIFGEDVALSSGECLEVSMWLKAAGKFLENEYKKIPEVKQPKVSPEQVRALQEDFKRTRVLND